MTFAELLTEYIGYKSIKDVASECERRGVKLDPSYLSRLKSGQRPAPDDELVVRTLAEACGREPEKLIELARFERRPHEAYMNYLTLAAQAAGASMRFSQMLVHMLERLVQDITAPVPKPGVREFAEGINPEKLRVTVRRLSEFTQGVLERMSLVDQTGEVSQAFVDMSDLPYDSLPSEETLVDELAAVTLLPPAAIKASIEALKTAVRPYRRPEFVAPKTEAEKAFLQVAKGLLGRKDLGVDDDLFEMARMQGRSFSDQEYVWRLEADGWSLWGGSQPESPCRTVGEFARGAVFDPPVYMPSGEQAHSRVKLIARLFWEAIDQSDQPKIERLLIKGAIIKLGDDRTLQPAELLPALDAIGRTVPGAELSLLRITMEEETAVMQGKISAWNPEASEHVTLSPVTIRVTVDGGGVCAVYISASSDYRYGDSLVGEVKSSAQEER